MENKKEQERVESYHREFVGDGLHYFEYYRGVIYHINPSVVCTRGIVSGQVYTSYKKDRFCMCRRGILVKYELFKPGGKNNETGV